MRQENLYMRFIVSSASSPISLSSFACACLAVPSIRLRLSELGDPKKQLAAINFLKLQGKWRTFPMKWKIGIWFGSLTRERLIEVDKQTRKKAEEKWQEGLLEAARN